MKITKAYYFHTFPNPVTGQWQKIGLEGELTEIDDYRQCLYELKRSVTDFYYESNKAAEKQLTEQKEEPKTQEQRIIDQINGCSDLKVLQSFELISRKYTSIQTAYNNKLKEFKNV